MTLQQAVLQSKHPYVDLLPVCMLTLQPARWHAPPPRSTAPLLNPLQSWHATPYCRALHSQARNPA